MSGFMIYVVPLEVGWPNKVAAYILSVERLIKLLNQSLLAMRVLLRPTCIKRSVSSLLNLKQ